MRESPLVTLIKTPWWLNLLIGLGMMSLGQLLKSGDGGYSLMRRSFGDGLQIVSVFFVVLALASFMIGASNGLSGGPDAVSRVPEPPPSPAQRQPAAPLQGQPPAHARPQQPAAPPPAKKKYTERDFMPPAMRAELRAKERQEHK